MGYFLLDNRASGGGVLEKDTQACPHCQAVIDKKKWREDGGIFYCSRCAKPLCHTCSSRDYKALKCDTWEQKIDRYVAEANWKAKIGGWA